MKNKLPLVGGIVLGAAFVFFAFPKLTAQPEVAGNFESWGLPLAMVYATGVMELLGGLLSLFTRTRFYGAGLIAIVMLGAIGTHLVNGDFGGMFPAAIVFLLLASLVAWSSRPGSALVVAPTTR